MKRLGFLVIGAICLLGLGLVLNTKGNVALPLSSEKTDTTAPDTEDQPTLRQDSEASRFVSNGLDRRAQVSLMRSGPLQPLAQLAATNTPAHPLPAQPTNTPALPVEPTNTPAPPVERNSNTISQIPALIVQDASPQMREQAPADSTVDQIHLGGETGHDLAGTLREAGIRFQIAEPGMGTIRPASPASPSQSCVEVIRNPQMDVVEFGDGTGSAEYWTILWQQIYFDNRAGYYRSASHSLAMADDPAVDSDIIDTSLDYDAFGQGFIAPSGLVSITIDYSRMYANMNEGDTAYYGLWTLDSEGYLDSLVVYWTIGGTSGAWQDRHGNLVDTAILAQLSGKSLAFVFDMETDRVAPNETIWVDDTQVTLCFDAGAYQTYMPHAINEPGPSGPTCSPAEPDAVDQRGSVDVGACCNGSFSATDLKDYYSLNLSGVTNVKLGLKDLPTGTNFDALIYQDSSGYPLKCQIGTPGDQDKWRDCPALDLTKVQFILVNAGTAPAPGSNTYTMCLLPQ